MLLAGTAAVALAAASTATFDATLTVTQDLRWTQTVSARSCDGGTFEIRGKGESHLRMRTTRRQRATARRVRGPRKATLGFARGSSLVPVTGTLTRTGTRSFGPTQGGSGERCGQPLPGPAPDCGRRSLPSDAVMGIALWSPDIWLYAGPAPLVPSVTVSGPTAPSWRTLYQNCPGIDGEESLFVLLQSPDEAPSGAGEVPLAWLFGSRRRIVVDATARRRLDLAKFNRAYISGSFPVTVTNRFKLTLTRR